MPDRLGRIDDGPGQFGQKLFSATAGRCRAWGDGAGASAGDASELSFGDKAERYKSASGSYDCERPNKDPLPIFLVFLVSLVVTLIGDDPLPAMLLEIAIDSLADALAAVDVGADRLEVCDRLDLGGLTPSTELVRSLASRVKVPLFAMIRPRGGDFLYTAEEYRLMERQMEEVAQAGAHGFVFGVLTPKETMDLNRTGELLHQAGPLPVTIHRAFDRCGDLFATAAGLADLGVERILTSGGKASAEEGADVLRELHQKMGRRIGILPGGGVRPSNIRRLLDHIGVEEFHSAARDERGVFDPRLVEKMKREVRRVSSEQ